MGRPRPALTRVGAMLGLAVAVATLVLAFGPPGDPTWSEFVELQYEFVGVDLNDWEQFTAFDEQFAPVAQWTNLGGGTELDDWFNATPRLNGYGRNRIAIHYAKPDAVGWFIIGDERLDQDLIAIGVDIIPALTKVVQVTTDADGVAWLYLPLDLAAEETGYFQFWMFDASRGGWVASNGLEMHTNLPLPQKRSTPSGVGVPPGSPSGPVGVSL
jgi:hypothetical protein